MSNYALWCADLKALFKHIAGPNRLRYGAVGAVGLLVLWRVSSGGKKEDKVPVILNAQELASQAKKKDVAINGCVVSWSCHCPEAAVFISVSCCSLLPCREFIRRLRYVLKKSMPGLVSREVCSFRSLSLPVALILRTPVVSAEPERCCPWRCARQPHAHDAVDLPQHGVRFLCLLALPAFKLFFSSPFPAFF